MTIVETYSTLDFDKWNQIIRSMIRYDFYSMCSYHRIAEFRNEGKAILFVFKEDHVSICLPLLIRPIINTVFFDATSVYGYSGPLFSTKIISKQHIISFQNQLSIFFRNNSIVSAFSRLHPLINLQHEILNGLGIIENHGSTVCIELSLSETEQRVQYRKSTKSELNRLKKLNLKIVKDKELKYLNDFVNIYQQNMRRVNATKNYMFDFQYFKNLLTSSDLSIELFLINKDDKNISGCLFSFSGDIIQYHLSGTLTEYLDISPTRMLIDYIRTENSLGKFKYFHLGGGVGGSNEDSLFKFKSGFSKTHNPFFVWKFIVNPQVYQELVDKKVSTNKDLNFFPLYRSF